MELTISKPLEFRFMLIAVSAEYTSPIAYIQRKSFHQSSSFSYHYRNSKPNLIFRNLKKLRLRSEKLSIQTWVLRFPDES